LRTLVLRARYASGIAVYLNGREVHRSNLPQGALTPATLGMELVSTAARKAFFPISLEPGSLRSGTNVLAAEVHQHRASDEDLVFDAELVSNRADTLEPPSVAFEALQEGALVKAGQEATVSLDAVAPAGKVERVGLFVDGRQAGSATAPMYQFNWIPGTGRQVLRAVAVSDGRREALQTVTVVGLKNIPPTARISVRPGAQPGTLVLRADAENRDGTIREVEFFMAETDRFDAPWRSVGKLSAPPFEVTIPDPRAQHRGVSVKVTDDGGEIGTASTHLHSHGN